MIPKAQSRALGWPLVHVGMELQRQTRTPEYALHSAPYPGVIGTRGLSPGSRRYLASRFDVDFVGLTSSRDGGDVREARRAIRECGLLETKIIAKVRRTPGLRRNTLKRSESLSVHA